MSNKFFWFFLATLLTLGEIYTIYLNSCSIKQSFKIRKIISTRYDLNQVKYDDFSPRLDLINEQHNYESKDYIYTDNKYNLKLPTEEELKLAEKYKNKVPNYKISKGGQIHEGVIIDDTSISNNNLNEPPPANATFPGDIAINKNQIKKKGELTSNLGQVESTENNVSTNYLNTKIKEQEEIVHKLNQQQGGNFKEEYPIIKPQ